MSKNQHSAQDFDRIFREKLGRHSVAPPAGMWENINANTQSSKRRRGLLWIITNDSTIMLLILLLSIFSFAESDFSASLSASEKTTDKVETANSILSKSETENTNNENRSRLENAGGSIKENEITQNESEQAQTSGSQSNTSLDDAQTSSNGNESSTKSDRVSTQLSSNSSNSGNANPETNEVGSDSSSDLANTESNKTERLGMNKENVSPLSTTERDTYNSRKDELTDKQAISSIQKKISQVEPSNKAFKWVLMRTIPPHLSITLNDDSLRKSVVDPITRKFGHPPKHEVFIGAHANFNLPLIFNQNTYGAFDGKELAYQPTFGLASGARIGYTYKRQYGFQTGFIFYSQQGQKYDDKLNGNVAKRQVNLKYFHVPFVLRYKFKIKKQQKFESPWVINLGADMGILQSAEITYDGNEYPLGAISNPEANDMDYFKPIDISVVLGVEKEIYFTKWLMLSIGMRTTFSGDINAEGHPVENDGKNYDKSHNFTFGFTLGLNYYLRK